MSVALLIELALKGALAAAMTLVVLQLMRGRSAAERSFVAHLGLAATLVIPALALLLPAWSVTALPAAIGRASAPLWLYLPPALLLGGVTLIAVWRLFGLRRRATVLVEPAWLGALAHAQRRMGFKSGAALLTSGDIASPVSWGLFRPTIVLDDRALAAHGEAEAIIAHELAHVARADWAKLLLARVATALHWFDPLVWMLSRQCHELREEAADDAVLNHDVDGAGYAAILVGSARHECRGMLLAAHGVAPGKGSLRRRVMRVLDTTRRRAPAGTGFAVMAFAAGLALGGPLAAVTLQAGPARAPVAPRAPTAPRAPAAPVAPHASVPVWASGPHAPAVPASPVAPVDPVAPVPATPPGPTMRYSMKELMAMRMQGVTPEWLRAMAANGHRDLSADDILALATQGVTPEYVRSMAAAGLGRLSADDLIAMRTQGVDPDYVRQMAAAGYRRATADELIAMRTQGISADYVREITRNGGPRPTPDQLMAYRTQGVSAALIRAAAVSRSRALAASAQARRVTREVNRSLRREGLREGLIAPRTPVAPVAPVAPIAPAPHADHETE